MGTAEDTVSSMTEKDDSKLAATKIETETETETEMVDVSVSVSTASKQQANDEEEKPEETAMTDDNSIIMAEPEAEKQGQVDENQDEDRVDHSAGDEEFKPLSETKDAKK